MKSIKIDYRKCVEHDGCQLLCQLILPNTEQEKSVNVSFAAPENLTISFDQVPGLMAGQKPAGMNIAKLTVDSASIKEYGARGC